MHRPPRPRALTARLPPTACSRWAHTHAATATEANPSTYCKDLVRKHDYNSFLVSYFFPRRTQDAYFALKAFNVELATIREAVSQPMIGQMRMRFWKDAVKAIKQDKPPQHPVALALHKASKEFKLSSYHLNRIIDARDADLFAPTPMTVESVTTYGENTHSTMLYLLLSILNQSSSDTFAHAASHIGVASSITTSLRSIPFHASQRRMVIPAELSAKNGVREEDVFRMGGDAEGVKDAVYDLASVAHDHLLSARWLFNDLGGKVPPEAMPVFLSAVPTAEYLAKLEEVGFDAFDSSLQKRDWKLAWKIWKANQSRTF